ncbi:hypothetical protein NDU88_001492 [Pleurodeles waltl]|uniref:Uncharacterized protein n=1 Tax=Pleurodeles waltl TaxID=8319 RepID=A0AAV7VB72_PLEWA|nr:hypothetical protein NDU88_001492 [Pleurodeles waltl]
MDARPPISGQVRRGGAVGRAQQQCPPPLGSKKGKGVSPVPGLFGVAAPSPWICVPLSAGESARRTCGQAGEASADRRLCQWSRQRGQIGGVCLLPQVLWRRVPPSRPAHHLRPRLVLLPQASGPCSALPTVYQGGALLLCAGHGPPTDPDPPDALRRCTGGPRRTPSATTPVLRPTASRSSAPRPPSWIVARPHPACRHHFYYCLKEWHIVSY